MHAYVIPVGDVGLVSVYLVHPDEDGTSRSAYLTSTTLEHGARIVAAVNGQRSSNFPAVLAAVAVPR